MFSLFVCFFVFFFELAFAGSVRSDNERVCVFADDGGHCGGSLPGDSVSAEAAAAAAAWVGHHADHVDTVGRCRSSLRHL